MNYDKIIISNEEKAQFIGRYTDTFKHSLLFISNLLFSRPIHTQIPQQYIISATASFIKSHKNVRIETSRQNDASLRLK
jgi:hypothetical protein